MKSLNAAFVLFGSLLFISPNVVHSETYAVLYTALGADISWAFGYPFEATIGRFYDFLYKQGIPKKNIITISPNAAPFHYRNPYPGVLIHNTGGTFEGNTINCVEHLEVDYDPKDFTAQSFYGLLAGNASAVKDIPGSGRVLESGPKDTVIVYFASVADDGVVLLNKRIFSLANEFIVIFERLDDEKRFGKMQLILDVDGPGSFFDDYLDKKNIMGYTFASRYAWLYLCGVNYNLMAYTSFCHSGIFFDAVEKFLHENKNSQDLAFHDFYTVHRKLVIEHPAFYLRETPNIYGDAALASHSFGSFYGKKAKASVAPLQQEQTVDTSVPAVSTKTTGNRRKVIDIISKAYNISEIKNEENPLERIVSHFKTDMNDQTGGAADDTDLFLRTVSGESEPF